MISRMPISVYKIKLIGVVLLIAPILSASLARTDLQQQPDSAGLITGASVISPYNLEELVRPAAWISARPGLSYQVECDFPDSSGWHIMLAKRAETEARTLWVKHQNYSSPNAQTHGLGKLKGTLSITGAEDSTLLVTAWKPPQFPASSRITPIAPHQPLKSSIQLNGQVHVRYTFRFLSESKGQPVTIRVHLTRRALPGE